MRTRFVTTATLRAMGVTPASVEPTSPATALLLANLKLSLAAMLKRDLNRNRRRNFIDNFNCRRADGTPIVSGCSVAGWERQRARALGEALAYLEIGGDSGG